MEKSFVNNVDVMDFLNKFSGRKKYNPLHIVTPFHICCCVHLVYNLTIYNAQTPETFTENNTTQYTRIQEFQRLKKIHFLLALFILFLLTSKSFLGDIVYA